MSLFEKCAKRSTKQIRRGGVFGKKYNMSVSIFSNRIIGSALMVIDESNGKESVSPISYDIPFEHIVDLSLGSLDDDRCIFIVYKREGLSLLSNVKIALMGLDDLDEVFSMLQDYRTNRVDQIKRERDRELLVIAERKEAQNKKEKEAEDFYMNCYSFHIKEETPVYNFSSEKNRIVAMFVGKDKSLNFMRIDGYTKEEAVGHIPFDEIHYYEKAGNVSYTTNIHGSYSSYGGSMIGGQFSKLAAALGGALFGFMGMATSALFSYAPAKQDPINTSFALDSNTIKIDDRNVILNFYSNTKKQFVDIELPREVYNFLQTYLPEKKYSIVEELEKKAAVIQSKETIESGKILHVAEKPAISFPLEEKPSETMEDFKSKVEKLKVLKDAGLLTDAEFDEERKKLLTLI